MFGSKRASMRDIPSTDALRRALFTAKAAANRRGDTHVRPEHVLLALVQEGVAPAAAQSLNALGIAPERVRRALEGSSSAAPEKRELPWDRRAKAVIGHLVAETRRSGRCTTAELLVAVAEGKAGLAAELLRWQGASPERLREAAAALSSEHEP